MNIFPAQYSTLSSAALQTYVEQHYGMENLRCDLRLRGVSDTYVLTGPADKYIVKVYRSVHRSVEEIKGEVELINILLAKGAKVAYPIADTTGEYVQIFNAAEGPRYGVVYSYAPGEPHIHMSDEQVQIAGREMAFNHNIVAGITLQHERKPYDLYTTMQRPLAILPPAFEKYYPEGYALVQQTATAVVKKLEALDTSGFSIGYCHYDYFPKNFFFDKNNQLTLFDFDFAGKGYLMNDPASFHVFCALYAATGAVTDAEAERVYNMLMQAYWQVRPVSEEEMKAVPLLGYLFLLFYLGYQSEHFDDWSINFFGTRYLKERVGLMEKYASQYCM